MHPPLTLLALEARLVRTEATTFEHLILAVLRLELSEELLLLTLALSLSCSLEPLALLLSVWLGLLVLLEFVLPLLLYSHR